MLTANVSHPAELLQWIGSLPAWGHGLYSAAEWRAWAREQRLTGGGRLWHYWATARGHGQGPAAATGKVRSCHKRIWLRSEWVEWARELPAGGWGLYTKAEWLDWIRSEDTRRRDAWVISPRLGPRGPQTQVEGTALDRASPPRGGIDLQRGPLHPHERLWSASHGVPRPSQRPAGYHGRSSWAERQDGDRCMSAPRVEVRGWGGVGRVRSRTVPRLDSWAAPQHTLAILTAPLRRLWATGCDGCDDPDQATACPRCDLPGCRPCQAMGYCCASPEAHAGRRRLALRRQAMTPARAG